MRIYFHVINTIHVVSYPTPQASAPDDSVFHIAERIYQYALWRQHGTTRFPVWEYQFTWSSGGVQVEAPWISGLGQAHALMLFGRGLEAIKYYANEYDTGYWTVYSRTQGYATISYHRLHVQLMDMLYTLSNDPWFKETADRWRAYQPPPGVR